MLIQATDQTTGQRIAMEESLVVAVFVKLDEIGISRLLTTIYGPDPDAVGKHPQMRQLNIGVTETLAELSAQLPQWVRLTGAGKDGSAMLINPIFVARVFKVPGEIGQTRIQFNVFHPAVNMPCELYVVEDVDEIADAVNTAMRTKGATMQ